MKAPDPADLPSAENPLPVWSRSDRRRQAAEDALRSFIRDCVEAEHGRPRIGDEPVELTLTVQLRPTDAFALEFSPSLEDQILDQFGDVVAERGIYREGRVYCFRCGSSGCDHAAPSAPTQVFRGYSSTGVPEWHELSQALIERRDARVERLYQERPEVAALAMSGKELKAEQLAAFGKASKSYALLGQVVAGHFRIDARRGRQNAGRFSLTLQFVETRTGKGRVGLRVNPVACLPDGQLLADLVADGWGEWVQRSIATARRSLQEMEDRINAAGPDRYRTARAVLSRLPTVMRRCAASLDRGHRQVRRRTRHAEERRKQQRPVQTALRDATAAGEEDLLYDERSDGIVVVGRQGRIHIFNADGRHMTSFVARPGMIEQRLRNRRWRLLEPEAACAFRLRLQAQPAVGEGRDLGPDLT